MNFGIGDRVRCVAYNPDGNDNIVPDTMGTIVCCLRYGTRKIGVCWDEFIHGHNCDGECKNGYGWYVGENDVELIEDDSHTEFTFDEKAFKKLMGK